MATTPLGKELRKLRIEHEERLIDMAKRLGRSASFISAVEVGKKAPPAGFEAQIVKAYRLEGNQMDTIVRAADRSRKYFVITPDTETGRETAALLARRIDSISGRELEKIQQILRGPVRGSKSRNDDP